MKELVQDCMAETGHREDWMRWHSIDCSQFWAFAEFFFLLLSFCSELISSRTLNKGLFNNSWAQQLHMSSFTNSPVLLQHLQDRYTRKEGTTVGAQSPQRAAAEVKLVKKKNNAPQPSYAIPMGQEGNCRGILATGKQLKYWGSGSSHQAFDFCICLPN